MASTARKVYSVAGALLMVELLAQFYFIAGAIFTISAKADQNAGIVKRAVQDADAFAALHSFNGYFLVPITMLVLVAIAFAARMPRRTIALTAVLFGLWIIQVVLAWIGLGGGALVAGLHGVNALIIVGLASALIGRNWAFRETAAASPTLG